MIIFIHFFTHIIYYNLCSTTYCFMFTRYIVCVKFMQHFPVYETLIVYLSVLYNQQPTTESFIRQNIVINIWGFIAQTLSTAPSLYYHQYLSIYILNNLQYML